MSLGSAIMAGTSNRPSTSHKAIVSSGTTDSVFTGDSGFSGSSPQTPMVTEKSYFSGNESSSKGRTVLQKKNSSSSSHHRKTSYTEEQRVRAGTALSRHSRIGSTDTVRGGSSPSLALPTQGKKDGPQPARRQRNGSNQSNLSSSLPSTPNHQPRNINSKSRSPSPHTGLLDSPKSAASEPIRGTNLRSRVISKPR
ncbi:hypothetical protein BDZ91DRAFT_798241 [Kalaharituber pfeilii]|nr:hypothetical protein BDZ91DRAFT_798241 [Kalaharituber pfeilii]